MANDLREYSPPSVPSISKANPSTGSDKWMCTNNSFEEDDEEDDKHSSPRRPLKKMKSFEQSSSFVTQTPVAKWGCPVCTFDNLNCLRCEICDYVKMAQADVASETESPPKDISTNNNIVIVIDSDDSDIDSYIKTPLLPPPKKTRHYETLSSDSDSDDDDLLKPSILEISTLARKKKEEESEKQTQNENASNRQLSQNQATLAAQEQRKRNQISSNIENTLIEKPPLPEPADGATNYPDLVRELALKACCLALLGSNHSKDSMTSHHYVRLTSFLSCYQKSPIRSDHMLQKLGVGCAEDTRKRLRDCNLISTEEEEGESVPMTPPVAALIILLEYSKNPYANGPMPLRDLLQKVNGMVSPSCKFAEKDGVQKSVSFRIPMSDLDNTIDDATMKSSPNFKMIENLGKPNKDEDRVSLIKLRKINKEEVVELLPSGLDTATKINHERRKRNNDNHGYLRELNSTQTKKMYERTTVCVDLHEGGSAKHHLHKMCDQLDSLKVPYFVAHLFVGDYLAFVDGNVAPLVIERKSIADVALSMGDGRWADQKRKMRKAQFVLSGGQRHRCKMYYIIEGRVDASNTVGGLYVGKRGDNIKIEAVEDAIASLGNEGFVVLRTDSMQHSVGKGGVEKLMREEVVLKMVRGEDLNGLPKMTLSQFKAAYTACDDKAGDAPAEVVGTGVINVDDDDDDDDDDRDEDENGGNGNDNDNDNNNNPIEVLKKLPGPQLKGFCIDRGLVKSGKKDELAARLMTPALPKLLVDRQNVKEAYTPKPIGSTAALCCALLQNSNEWMAKDPLMNAADALGIRGDKSMFDKLGGGMYNYDGWSGMYKSLIDNQVEGNLVMSQSRKKFKLTERGVSIARCLHLNAHSTDLCACVKYELDSIVENDSSDLIKEHRKGLDNVWRMCYDGR